MQQDDVVWELINHGFCCYKSKLDVHNFCRNVNNVTGMCSKQSCPLANSRYATVREHQGVCYLYVKTIERAHMPARMWERIKLNTDYMEALKQIDEVLLYWPKPIIHRCKQRLTKMTQYLIRKRKLATKTTRELVTVHKKTERQDASRLKKAEVAAQLDNQIKKELYSRLLKGTVYPEMENISKHFNEVLQEHAIPEEQQVAKQQQLEEFVEGGESEIEEELEEEPEDMEDMEYFDEDEVMDDDDLDDEEAEKTPTKRASDRKSQSADEEPQPSPAKRRKVTPSKKRDKPYVHIEYEEEREPTSISSTLPGIHGDE